MKVFSFKSYLSNNSDFQQINGLYYQRGLKTAQPFESAYRSLRAAEGRLYSDEIVSKLPEFPEDHPLKREWTVRKKSALRLIEYLRKRKAQTILEIGCGNGWLINQIWLQVDADSCGVDVNETELKQAVAVFGEWEKLSFVYGDIESDIFANMTVDTVILASALQYFREPGAILLKLKKLLTSDGEIHIIDSPVYQDETVAAARERSQKYFADAGQADMQPFYFHHSWKIFSPFEITIRYNPESWWNKVFGTFFGNSPFPWIILKK